MVYRDLLGAGISENPTTATVWTAQGFQPMDVYRKRGGKFVANEGGVNGFVNVYPTVLDLGDSRKAEIFSAVRPIPPNETLAAKYREYRGELQVSPTT